MGNDQKNPILACILSLIVPGLGQIYNKQYIKGILYLLVPLLLWTFAFLINPYNEYFLKGIFNEFFFASIFAFIIRILSALDAKNDVENGNTEDYTKESFKNLSIGRIVKDKRNIVVILFILFFLNGIAITDYGHTKEVTNFNATGSIIATNSNFKYTNYTPATQDTFVATSEDANYWYGHWNRGHDASYDYNVTFTVDLADANITNVTPYVGSSYSYGYDYDYDNDYDDDDYNYTTSSHVDYNATNATVPDFNATAIKEYLEENMSKVINSSGYDDLEALNSDIDDPDSYDYDLNGTMLTCDYEFTTSEVLDVKNVTYVLHYNLNNKTMDITINIPRQNIHLKDPGVASSIDGYSVDTSSL